MNMLANRLNVPLQNVTDRHHAGEPILFEHRHVAEFAFRHAIDDAADRIVTSQVETLFVMICRTVACKTLSPLFPIMCLNVSAASDAGRVCLGYRLASRPTASSLSMISPLASLMP
jgi:hypothetical protein